MTAPRLPSSFRPHSGLVYGILGLAWSLLGACLETECGPRYELEGRRCIPLAAASVEELEVTYGLKSLSFAWSEAHLAKRYELVQTQATESGDGTAPAQGNPETQDKVYETPAEGERRVAFDIAAHLHDWWRPYRVDACNDAGCSPAARHEVTAGRLNTVGYVKPVNPDGGDRFGFTVALSSDGSTLAVGAPSQNLLSQGQDTSEDSLPDAGAVFVFARGDDPASWQTPAQVEAQAPHAHARFGSEIAFDAEGTTLVVGAPGRHDTPEGSLDTGEAFVFAQRNGIWQQQARLTGGAAGNRFGESLALSAEADVLAVGASRTQGDGTGVHPDHALDERGALRSGAVYVFIPGAEGLWQPKRALKGLRADQDDAFGFSLALNADGTTLAVGATGESSLSTGIGGDMDSNDLQGAGAVYLY